MAKVANMILMGPPGAGKGTQSERILSTLSIPHISTGDMFREAIAAQTELGKKVSSYIHSGALVPDDVTIAIVKERLSRDDCKKGYLLDGFPRTIAQAEALKELSHQISREVNLVVHLACDKQALIERISGRRVCPKCGNSYHIQFKKSSKENICDGCGASLVQRKDDTIESLNVRLSAYETQTKPLIAFYQQEGILHEVDGLQDIEAVFQDISHVLKEFQ